MKRGGYLKRSPMKKRKRRSRGEKDDAKYLAFVRKLPCCAPMKGWVFECEGPVEAHHLTGAGVGQKADDHDTMPLCRRHHRDLHEFTGPFAKTLDLFKEGPMSRGERQEWQLKRIKETRFLWIEVNLPWLVLENLTEPA